MKQRPPHVGTEEIQKMRRALCASKKAFGKRLGISGETIATWERRGSMSKPNQRMLARVYEQLLPLIAMQEKFLKKVGLSNVTSLASVRARKQHTARTLMEG